ncbi:phosphorylase family protein [Methyloterricola oryzae]|uniref:phosphorylase family protein n=1 Tax=Methyloterricola oryzae TaxID=1495050 RepID=UPI0005EB15D7|nr:hypothetical protein [Methyloterricola oryzae]
MGRKDDHIFVDYPRIERLFLHYFDIHFLQNKGRVVETKAFQEEMRLATRLAVASADRVLVPAASYFESSFCRQTIDEFGDLIRLGVIMLVGSSLNLDEFIREHQDEQFYRKGSKQYIRYRSDVNLDLLPAYQHRQSGATQDIVECWVSRVNSEELQRLLRDAAGKPVPHLDRRLESVPRELGGLAFVPDHVFEILGLSDTAFIERARITGVINEAYFDSYTRELGAGVIFDLSHLASDFKVPSYGRNLSYLKMIRFLMSADRLKTVAECNPEILIALGNDQAWRQALQTSVVRVQSQQPLQSKRNLKNPKISSSPTSITKPTHSVLCIAAATSELAAVRRRFDNDFGKGQIIALVDDMSDFAVSYLDSTTSTRWSLATLAFQGQVEISSRLGKLIHSLNPTLILMVGMCMGMPTRNYPLGTVIVPNEVISFDHRRLTVDGDRTRPHGERVTGGLYMLARLINADDLNYKVVTDKGLASASTKIENPDANLVKFIHENFPDVAAFDMEGGGFYRASDGVECLWIKAVADSGEPQAHTCAGQDEKHVVQDDVTGNAVDFAIRLIRQFIECKGYPF